MKSIYKYDIPIKDEFTLDLPKGAVFVSFMMQHDNPRAWFMVNTAEPNVEKRVFRLAGTGHNMNDSDGITLKPLGSVQMSGGSLIFHLLEIKKLQEELGDG